MLVLAVAACASGSDSGDESMEANPSPCRFFADRSLPREEQQLTALYERYHCFLDDLLVDLESTPPSAMRVEELQRLLGWPTDHCSAHTVRIERFPYRTIPEGTLEAVEGGLTCAEGRVIPISGLLGIPNGTPRNGFLLTIPGTASGPERDFGVETSTYDSADYAHQFAQRAMGEGFIVFSPPRVLTDLLLDPVSGYNGRRGEIDRRAQVLGTRLHGIELFALSETVNELQNFPEIQGQKVGAYGISLGGSIAFWLGALNPSIDAVVSSQWVEERTDKLAGRENPWSMWRFEDADYVVLEDAAVRLKDERVAQLIAPRPLLLEYGDLDPRAEDVLPVWDRLIDLYPSGSVAEGRLRLVVESGGHEIFFDQAIDFLKTWLQSD